ncbi:MAG: AI-2E family transporter [Gammaproteobacteria bacterium]|nr:AI-2E family transporter [Gammaproteobacteria bacterium]
MARKNFALNETRIDHYAGFALAILLVLGCYFVLRPFLSAVLLAVILSFTTWPLYHRIEQGLRGRRGLASGIMVMLVTAVLIVPLILVGVSLTDNVRIVIEMARHLLAYGPPTPPDWVLKIPLVGSSIHERWQDMAGSGARLTEELTRYLMPLRDWALLGAAKLGEGIMYLSLSVFISFFIYRDSAVLAGRAQDLLSRVGGERGAGMLGIAGNTIKSVIYGIIGTALAQGVLAGIGIFIAGVPGALLLGAISCLLSLIPLGSSLAWGISAIWLFQQGETGSAIFLVIWGLLVVSTIDNFLKPYFISKGSKLPFILVFLGGLGGVLAFGFLGIFIGPTLLAIVYNILQEWSSRKTDAVESPAAGP